MGNLRARSDDEKALKRKQILDTAWVLLKQSDGKLPTAMEIAKKSGVAKGTVYVYFKTKEEIFLSLFVSRLTAWASDAEKRIENTPSPDIVSVSTALANYPCKHPFLLVLGSMLHGILEKNAPFEAVLNMKIAVARLMEQCGVLFNKHLPWLPQEMGAKSMLTLYNLYTGIYHAAATPDDLKEALQEKDVQIFDVDMESDMIQAGLVLFTGIKTLVSPQH